MVRVFIKGGVWKNSEDEILKAAVMKYGKQQWARVASLLNRKSAKQCKARWNEWLDPSVRKVEWSRAEDEKLLHLAKLLPAQWRTIGPLVGRTATQCQERYERLLDEAAAAAAGATASADGAAPAEDEKAAAAAAHARKLRPGQIDPHPETRPARPDPVDMDEDEIEMLQEARARLANTQGKKAKRKERERMLAEAKRLADLQKRRELKQAGLLSGAARTRARGGKRKRRDIDLGVEIPFHKPAPAGFHSTDAEDERAERARAERERQVNFKKVNEAQYRSRDREDAILRKREEARLRALERSNMQYVVAEVSKRNDPVGTRKRGVLQMPAPTVGDDELERVARLGRERVDAGRMGTGPRAGGGSATDALLVDYSDRPLPTPMRTPASAGMGGAKLSAQEAILREASNLRMIERGQTPLLGEDNPDLRDGGAGTGVGLRGKAATAAEAAALNAATPMIGMTPSATPMTSRGAGDKTPLSHAPPPRDEFGLNRPASLMRSGMGASGYGGDDVSVSATSFATTTVTGGGGGGGMSIKELARAERRAAKRARLELEEALAALPAPQFEYELAAPEAITEEEEGDDDDDDERAGQSRVARERDAADLDREEEERLRKEAERIYEKRSMVVKIPELPRPVGPVRREALFFGGDANETKADEDEAEILVMEEMLTLLQHDGRAHPVLFVDVDEEDGARGGDKKKRRKKKGKGKMDKKKKARRRLGGHNEEALPPEKSLEYIPEEAIVAAKGLIEKELESVLCESGANNGGGARSSAASRVNVAASADGARSLLYVHGKGWTTLEDPDGPPAEEKRWRALRAERAALIDAVSAVGKKADKLEARLNLRHGGYARRFESMREAALQSFADLRHAAIEEDVYSTLMAQERRGAAARIERMEEEVRRLEEDEAAAQKNYGDLIHERNRLRLLLRQKQERQVV